MDWYRNNHRSGNAEEKPSGCCNLCAKANNLIVKKCAVSLSLIDLTN